MSIPGEIRVNHPDGFYSYAAKYFECEQTELIVPAPLRSDLVQQLQQKAADIFRCLQCKGMARIDFFVQEERDAIYFNEVNSIPGFTSMSMYPKMWEASGLPYAQLLDQLITLAMSHFSRKQHLVTHYQ